MTPRIEDIPDVQMVFEAMVTGDHANSVECTISRRGHIYVSVVSISQIVMDVCFTLCSLRSSPACRV